MEIRSFLAFELPSPIKDTLSRISGEIKKSPLDLKCVKVDNIHLTIIFMGNISESLINPLTKAVSGVCQGFGPFDISLNGVGVFTSKRIPRVLWAGLDGDIDRMSRFRNTLQRNLNPFGIKEEKRKFKPHLTLGRFRKGSQPTAYLEELNLKYMELTSPVYTLKELVLFKSDLRPSGAVYTKLKSWPLEG